MTLLHRPRSGDVVRPRRGHHLPAGPAELRLHRDPGIEHGRVPPGRLPVGDGGAAARREGDPRRPALHAHERRLPTCTCRCAPGSDIAFLGGLVNHVLENERWFDEYVRSYTNAATIVDEDFADTEDLDGLFSGWDPERARYDTDDLAVRGHGRSRPPGARERGRGRAGARRARRRARGRRRRPTDPTLQHPRCVFQILRRHFSRYTPEMVEQVCGVPRAAFLEVAEALCDELRPRAHLRVRATRSAGRSTRSASSTSARPRSSSCCSATSAAPAAASWRCAGTRRSRARPTSRRSTTSCPATCRCRAPARERHGRRVRREQHAADRLLGPRATRTSSAC